MTTPHEYQHFLSTHFPGLVLQKPVFYNWPFGLRFDLQGLPSKGADSRRPVLERATALFEAVFAPTDRVLVLVRDYKYRRRKIRFGNYLHRQIRGLVRAELAHTTARLPDLYPPAIVFNHEFLRLPAHRIAHRPVLAAIAREHFPSRSRRVREAPELYFLNLDQSLILHMYDARGLDLIAGNPQALRPFYERFHAWLLAYDRDQMDLMFK